MTAPSIAIVGSGPSGCYAAQFLRRKWDEAEIVVLDSSSVPYGLVRFGIAPDHLGHKAVTRQFDRIFERGRVRFVGGVEVGRDVSYEALAEAFDIVVLATGMEADRRPEVPVHPAARVVGAGTLMRALNNDPAAAGVVDAAGGHVAVLGHGNVALDAVRMLAAPAEHFESTDIAAEEFARLRRTPVRRIDVVGRSGAAAAKFDLAVLKEILRLPGVAISSVGLSDGDDCEVACLLRAAAAEETIEPSTEVGFWFDAPLQRVGALAGATVVALDSPSGAIELVVDTLVTAIGFCDRVTRPSQSGVLGREHVFRTGWARRGAVGGVAANRKCAQDVVADIVEAFDLGRLSTGRPGFAALASTLAAASPLEPDLVAAGR